MKVFVLVLVLFATTYTIGCAQNRDTSASKPAGASSIEQVMNSFDYVEGIVTSRYIGEGCKFLIEFMGKDGDVLINPVNLPERYKKDGARVSITYTPSKAPQLDNCKLGIWSHITLKK